MRTMLIVATLAADPNAVHGGANGWVLLGVLLLAILVVLGLAYAILLSARRQERRRIRPSTEERDRDQRHVA
ncbi:MAG TPA: hypothetical protein VE976_07670 [Actinomycetota bacterium]|nr:hypothetical protein [Actinomycetota bacterium]